MDIYISDDTISIQTLFFSYFLFGMKQNRKKEKKQNKNQTRWEVISRRRATIMSLAPAGLLKRAGVPSLMMEAHGSSSSSSSTTQITQTLYMQVVQHDPVERWAIESRKQVYEIKSLPKCFFFYILSVNRKIKSTENRNAREPSSSALWLSYDWVMRI